LGEARHRWAPLSAERNRFTFLNFLASSIIGCGAVPPTF